MATIAVVEDEYIVALDIKRHLERFGYEVPRLYRSAEELFGDIENHRFDIVLTDIKLQGKMDGVEAAGLLFEKYRLPVILITAYADEETVSRAKFTQPFGYILKPFEERELRTAIEIALYRLAMERELKTRDELLRQSQKMEAIGRLAGGVAHDFNNIITAILGFTSLLQEQLGGGEGSEPNEDLAGIKKAAYKAASLTRQLLAFSRHQVLSPRLVNVNDLIEDMERMLRRLIGEDVRMSLDLAADAPRVLIDPGQFEQVLVNLVVNARDAMPSGGSLLISTAGVRIDERCRLGMDELLPGRYLKVSVRDTGIGIDEAALPKIFDPFFTTKDPEKGTGLGLSTVYGIVKQSSGSIGVQSAPGHGSEFSIYLPEASDRGETIEQAEEGPEGERGTERILLVEDEADLLNLLKRVLSQAGYDVTCASSSGEAILIAEADKEGFDLLISDVVMAYLSGYELASRLRREHRGLKVLFISGYPDKHPEPGSEFEGAFIQKPFSDKEFLSRVRQCLDGPC